MNNIFYIFEKNYAIQWINFNNFPKNATSLYSLFNTVQESRKIDQAVFSNKETQFYHYMTWLYSVLDAHPCITNE
jgi:hypothetical protein